MEAVPTQWPPEYRAYGQRRDQAESRRGQDQGQVLGPCERVGGQQHLPTHVRPLHAERDPGLLVYRLWGGREPCTRTWAITPRERASHGPNLTTALGIKHHSSLAVRSGG